MILIVVMIMTLTGLYIVIKNFSFRSSPYLPEDKQRAALLKKPFVTPVRLLDSASILNDLKFLASDTCEGRQPGSTGYTMATERIISRMREAGLDSFNKNFTQIFEGKYLNRTRLGKNIIGWIKGTQYPQKYIVISAHYDHLGKIPGKIYHGASDNASGVACILAMAKYFRQHPQPYSLIFVAFDREETGMEGSFYFVEHLPSPLHLSAIRLNLNVDMIARNDKNEIFICGIYHYPSLAYAVNEIQNQTNAKVLMGHDTGNIRENWTNLSDHFPFHQKHIPFLYVGVEDHVDYHKPGDTWDKFNLNTYIENCNLAALLAKTVRL